MFRHVNRQRVLKESSEFKVIGIQPALPAQKLTHSAGNEKSINASFALRDMRTSLSLLDVANMKIRELQCENEKLKNHVHELEKSIKIYQAAELPMKTDSTKKENIELAKTYTKVAELINDKNALGFEILNLRQEFIKNNETLNANSKLLKVKQKCVDFGAQEIPHSFNKNVLNLTVKKLIDGQKVTIQETKSAIVAILQQFQVSLQNIKHEVFEKITEISEFHRLVQQNLLKINKIHQCRESAQTKKINKIQSELESSLLLTSEYRIRYEQQVVLTFRCEMRSEDLLSRSAAASGQQVEPTSPTVAVEMPIATAWCEQQSQRLESLERFHARCQDFTALFRQLDGLRVREEAAHKQLRHTEGLQRLGLEDTARCQTDLLQLEIESHQEMAKVLSFHLSRAQLFIADRGRPDGDLAFAQRLVEAVDDQLSALQTAAAGQRQRLQRRAEDPLACLAHLNRFVDRAAAASEDARLQLGAALAAAVAALPAAEIVG